MLRKQLGILIQETMPRIWINMQVCIRQELSKLKAIYRRYQEIIVSIRHEHWHLQFMNTLVRILWTRDAEFRERLGLALCKLGAEMRSTNLISGEDATP